MPKGKVALISVDQYGPAIGVRFLSAVLKRAGYETVVLFARGAVSRQVALGKARVFPDHIHDQIAALVAGSLYVGISVVTPTYHKAREITIALGSRIHVPVIWGGIHAIVVPDECLEYADMVCTGEGEELVVELAERLRAQRAYNDIPGLKLRHQLPVTQVPRIDIAHLCAPDYAHDGSHYIVGPHEITRIDDLWAYRWFLGRSYEFAPTRGCPYRCTYCANDRLAVLYRGARIKRFRTRDLDHVLRELLWAKYHFAFSRAVIIDDCFMALKEDAIGYFAAEYKKHIGLPLVIHGADSPHVTEKKLELLCDAGLMELRVGIQTGSDHIRRLYDRTWESNATILDTAHLIHRFINRGRLSWVVYYVILDNPWESQQDRIDTFELIASLPRPFSLTLYSLTFFPGTSLYERARAEKLVRGDTTDAAYWKNYKWLRPTPVNETLFLMAYLPLSPTRMRWLARDKPLANTVRRIVRKLVVRTPEVMLFVSSLGRYEIDFLVRDVKCNTLDAFRRLNKDYTEYLDGAANSSPVIVALRRFLLGIHIKLRRLKLRPGTSECLRHRIR